MELKLDRKYLLENKLVFKYIGKLGKLSCIEFDQPYVKGIFSEALSYEEILDWIVNSKYKFRENAIKKRLNKYKYYHCVPLREYHIKKYYIRNTALARKLHKNATENGEWLNL